MTANIRIYACNQYKETQLIAQYISNVVPRVGEYICVQFYKYLVYRIEHTILDGVDNVDVFCSDEDKEILQNKILRVAQVA